MEVKICNQQTNTPPSVGLQEGSAGEKMGLRDAALPPSPLILLLLTTPILLQGTTAQNTVFSIQKRIDKKVREAHDQINHKCNALLSAEF